MQAGFQLALWRSATNSNRRTAAHRCLVLGAGQPAVAAPATTAARRAGGRGGGVADLFGGVAQAGGEQDVMTSASSNPQAAPVDDRLTGARNENSVLFSLAALTSNAPKKEEIQAPGTEGSGLIDIRALSASMEQKKDGNKKVDDIMNLSGGGAFSAALAAPVLAPAPMDAGDYAAPGEHKNSNATLHIGIIAGFVIVGVLVAGGVFLAMSKSSQSAATTATSSSTAAAPTTSVAMARPSRRRLAARGPPTGGAGTPDPNVETIDRDQAWCGRTSGGGAKPPVGRRRCQRPVAATQTRSRPPVAETWSFPLRPPTRAAAAVVVVEASAHQATSRARWRESRWSAAGGPRPTPQPRRRRVPRSRSIQATRHAASLGPIANGLGSCKRGWTAPHGLGPREDHVPAERQRVGGRD